jgi:hypothetical protein
MKLSKEELQELKSNQQASNDVIFTLGELELQKTSLIDRYRELALSQSELGDQLSKKYGDGKINLNTGEVTSTDFETSPNLIPS